MADRAGTSGNSFPMGGGAAGFAQRTSGNSFPMGGGAAGFAQHGATGQNAQARDPGTDGSAQSFQVPSISLPKSGGAIRGIGEKFAANPVTNTGSLTIPIAVSPGRSGFGPQLTLSYDSGSGKGPFGYGWSLLLPAITRKTNKGLPQYRDALKDGRFGLAEQVARKPVVGCDRWQRAAAVSQFLRRRPASTLPAAAWFL